MALRLDGSSQCTGFPNRVSQVRILPEALPICPIGADRFEFARRTRDHLRNRVAFAVAFQQMSIFSFVFFIAIGIIAVIAESIMKVFRRQR